MLFKKSLYRRAKRVLDFTAGGVGLVLTLPVQGTVAGAVLLSLGRPILFRQERPGLRGEIFTLVKFRTMSLPNGDTQSDAERMTALGRFLRATSLDELPTLWNVVKGEMSLVGPRPLLVKYLCLYTEEQMRRHEVRPGITGLAQVSGRNAIPWDEKLKLDVEYVNSLSLKLDLEILARTVKKILVRDGISQAGHATMPEFVGSEGQGDPIVKL